MLIGMNLTDFVELIYVPLVLACFPNSVRHKYLLCFTLIVDTLMIYNTSPLVQNHFFHRRDVACMNAGSPFNTSRASSTSRFRSWCQTDSHMPANFRCAHSTPHPGLPKLSYIIPALALPSRTILARRGRSSSYILSTRCTKRQRKSKKVSKFHAHRD